jgi:hypothetical protein
MLCRSRAKIRMAGSTKACSLSAASQGQNGSHPFHSGTHRVLFKEKLTITFPFWSIYEKRFS